MTQIEVYDAEAEALRDKAEQMDVTIAELVEMLCEYLPEVE